MLLAYHTSLSTFSFDEILLGRTLRGDLISCAAPNYVQKLQNHVFLNEAIGALGPVLMH